MSNKIVIHEQTLRIQYQNGMSVKRIADLHGVTDKTVMRNLKEYNIKRINKLLTLISKKKLEQLYCDYNWTISKIARRYKVNRRTVDRALMLTNLKKSRAKGNGN